MKSQPQLRKWRPAVPAILISALTLAACESPPPTAALNRATAAIEGAQLEGAQQLAPAQLQSAQQKLANARTAVGQKEMEQAKYLAEEAEMQGINAEQVALLQKAENAQGELQSKSPGFSKGIEQEKRQGPTQQRPQ